MFDFLEEQGVNRALLDQVRTFLQMHSSTTDRSRIPVPPYHYYGKSVWEQAIAALLAGENLLLVGSKATGKNVLADNLARLFERPSWNISFHLNTDSASLLGTDTFSQGRVSFRKGPIACCAEAGGFGVLDEINMARNDAVAVLHATLDYRRVIDIPGYDRIFLRPETRFIATMNYGYVGTRELNEALTSRFSVIQVPPIGTTQLHRLLREQFPTLREDYIGSFSKLFLDLQKKNDNGEISSKSVDLRGLLAAIALMQRGLTPETALMMGLTNKSFDPFEQEIIADVIHLTVNPKLRAEELFAEDEE